MPRPRYVCPRVRHVRLELRPAHRGPHLPLGRAGLKPVIDENARSWGAPLQLLMRLAQAPRGLAPETANGEVRLARPTEGVVGAGVDEAHEQSGIRLEEIDHPEPVAKVGGGFGFGDRLRRMCPPGSNRERRRRQWQKRQPPISATRGLSRRSGPGTDLDSAGLQRRSGSSRTGAHGEVPPSTTRPGWRNRIGRSRWRSASHQARSSRSRDRAPAPQPDSRGLRE